MKKIFVVSILFLFAFMVSAQQGGGGQRGQGGPGGFQQTPEQREARYQTMKTNLTLTDAQLGQIKKLDEEYQPKLTGLREKFPNDREKMAEERTKLMNEQNAKIKGFLNADQYTKYVETYGSGRGFGGQGGGQGGGNRQGGGGRQN